MAVSRIVDAHHHLWNLEENSYPWLMMRPAPVLICGSIAPIQRSYTVDNFRADIGDLPVLRSVHVEANWDDADPVGETRWLQQVADTHGLPHGIVGAVDLADPAVEKVLEGHVAFPNVRGVRQILNRHPDPHLNAADRDYLDDDGWRRNFGLLAGYGLSFDLQVYPSQMAAAAHLAAAHSSTAVILGHTGMPADQSPAGLDAWRRGLRDLAAQDNVSVKISGLGMVLHDWTIDAIRPLVLDTIDIFGVDRCMFASNFPVDSLHGSYAAIWDAFAEIVADFSAAEQDALHYGNAVRIYRL